MYTSTFYTFIRIQVLTFVTLSAAVPIVFNKCGKLAEVYFIHNITMTNYQQWTLPPRASVLFVDRFYFRHYATIKDDEIQTLLRQTFIL